MRPIRERDRLVVSGGYPTGRIFGVPKLASRDDTGDGLGGRLRNRGKHAAGGSRLRIKEIGGPRVGTRTKICGIEDGSVRRRGWPEHNHDVRDSTVQHVTRMYVRRMMTA
jgi:hypothetical protein